MIIKYFTKKFEGNGKDRFSINFFDDDENYVGFETEQQCCEHTSYQIGICERSWDCDTNDHVYNETLWINMPTGNELDGVELLKNYFFTGKTKEGVFRDTDGDRDGEYIEFELQERHETLPDRAFLRIINAHNGYYAHSWDFKFGDEKQEGSI